MSSSLDLILIDSRNRNSGDSQSYNISLEENLNGTYELATFSMSNNFYNVVTGENDKIYLNHSVDGNRTATLTQGNYTGSTLATMLKTVMDAAMATITFTVAYSSSTGKITFTPSGGTFGFRFSSNSSQTARYVIGKNAVDDSNGASQVSDNPIELSLHKHICIKIAQDSNQHVTLSNGVEASLIIPIDDSVPFNEGIIQYQRNKGFNQLLTFGSQISSLDITLYSNDGDNLPVNATEHTFCLKKLY